MAIFHMVDDPDMIDEEYEYEYEDNDILDDMLETCYSMIDDLSESTATQRHYGFTTKDVQKAANYDKNISRQLDDYEKKIGGPKKFVKNVAYINSMSDSEVGSKAAKTTSMRNIDKSKRDYIAKAGIKGSSGYAMKRLHQAGHDVKGEYNKAKNYYEKKKAVKEACYTILGMLDEI